MLINLWSTPRTGSVWTSIRLLNESRELGNETHLMTEMFNRWHMDVYRVVEAGSVRNVHQYESGSYYVNYSLDERGVIKQDKVYAPRSRDIESEEQHRIEIINSCDINVCTLILHNHTSPLATGVYEKLCAVASRNIYIGRKSISQQLASYGVAMATREFARFKDSTVPLNANDWNLRPDHKSLEQLTERVLNWMSLVDIDNDEVLWYEKLDFSKSYPGSTVKQNRVNPLLRLHPDTREYIRDCEDHFRNRLYEITLSKKSPLCP